MNNGDEVSVERTDRGLELYYDASMSRKDIDIATQAAFRAFYGTQRFITVED